MLIEASRRTLLAAVLAGLGIAVGSGGLSLMLWGDPQPSAVVASGLIPPPDSVMRQGALRPHSLPAAAPPIRLDVPAIHVSSALLGLRLQNDGTLQVPGDPAQAGWWSEGTAPGNPGPAIIVGHVDSLNGPGVFYRLSALHPGDKVLIGRADGSTATFSVDALRQYAKDAFPTDLVYGATLQPTLRLLTCGGAFNRGTGHYTDNLVVFAHLVGVADPAAAPSPTPSVPSHPARRAM